MPEEKKTKIAQATIKPKSGTSKFMSNFVTNDVPTIKNHILIDVLIPTIKKIISETINIILYNDTGGSRVSRGGTNATRVSYREYYDNSRTSRSTSKSYSKTEIGFFQNDFVLPSRGDCEAVLSSMEESIDRFGFVTINDLCDLIGVSGSHTDQKYGWINLTSAEVRRVHDGYTLKLPRAVPID